MSIYLRSHCNKTAIFVNKASHGNATINLEIFFCKKIIYKQSIKNQLNKILRVINRLARAIVHGYRHHHCGTRAQPAGQIELPISAIWVYAEFLLTVTPIQERLYATNLEPPAQPGNSAYPAAENRVDFHPLVGIFSCTGYVAPYAGAG
ncbi:MAG: hypothetical protein V4446_04875 [Pseudomonadota bacterium]